MQPRLHNVLSISNTHPRGNNINFFEKDHKYVITFDTNAKYTSVTTWVHEQFPIFDANDIINKMMKGKNWNKSNKYWGMTPEQIKEKWDDNKKLVSCAGTDLHFNIECFMNNPNLKPNYSHSDLYENINDTNINDTNNDTLEWQYFINFIKSTPNFKPYRTEWCIYHEDLKIAGSIDMVYENSDGTLSIYDWKRCKDITTVNYFNKYGLTESVCHLHDTNFWHYALQLNIYKKILEDKYAKVIKDLFLVKLHPESTEGNYEIINIPFLENEIIKLCNERMKKV